MITIQSVLVACDVNKSFSIPIQITSEGQKKIVETTALIDSGAGGKFIDQNYATKLGLEPRKLDKELRVRNVDGTLNKTGKIKYYTVLDLTING